MKKIILLLVCFMANSFALSLSQVRANLKANAISQDSVEMSIRTTITSVVGKQVVTVYMAQKGTSKIYTEMKTSFMNQRSIINGSRMKVIDLNTGKFQILPYNGEDLEVESYTKFNPLDAGEWEEPVRDASGLYTIKGTLGVVYYDSQKKRIEKVVNDNDQSSTVTTFTYDASNNMKTMEVSVLVNGVETKVLTEIVALRSSKNFPDGLFDF